MFRVSGVMVLEERGCLRDRPDQPVWRCLSSSRVAVYLRSAGTSYRRVGCGVLSSRPTVVSSELSCRVEFEVVVVRHLVGAVVGGDGSRFYCRVCRFYCRVYVCAGYFNLQQLAFYIVSSSRVS